MVEGSTSTSSLLYNRLEAQKGNKEREKTETERKSHIKDSAKNDRS